MLYVKPALKAFELATDAACCSNAHMRLCTPIGGVAVPYSGCVVQVGNVGILCST